MFFSLAVTQKMSRVLAFPGDFLDLLFPKATDAAISRCKGGFDNPSQRSERMGQELSSTDASGPLASVRLFLDAFQQFGEKQEKGTVWVAKVWGFQQFLFR